MPFVAEGDRGELRVGHHLAATICTWRLMYRQDTLGQASTIVSARIGLVDRFWSTHTLGAPVRLALWMGKSWWAWREVSLPAMETIEAGSNVDFAVAGTPMAQQ